MTVKVDLAGDARAAPGSGLLPADFYAYEDLLPTPRRRRSRRLREFLRDRGRADRRRLLGAGRVPDAARQAASRSSGLLVGRIPTDGAEPSNSAAGLHRAGARARRRVASRRSSACRPASRWARSAPAAPRSSAPSGCRPMSRFEKIGAFGLTEPLGGSDVAGGMGTDRARATATTGCSTAPSAGSATRPSPTACVIWARDVDDEPGQGLHRRQRHRPASPRRRSRTRSRCARAERRHRRSTTCRVPEANRLQNANSFRDTAEVLRLTRAEVAWEAVGHAARGLRGRRCSTPSEREQFGRPIGSFQLVQDLLVKMLGNVTASLGMMVRVSQLQDAGARGRAVRAGQGLLRRARMRETVALGARAAGRQRHRARLRHRPVLRRRRGDLLLRGHPRDEHADRRARRHRPERVRVGDDDGRHPSSPA